MAKRYRLKHHQLAAELAKKRHSQNRWADVLDLGRGHLSLLVNGKRPYPSEDTRRKLLVGLDIPFSTLFEIEDVPLPGRQIPRHLAWIPRAEPPGVVMPLESQFHEVRQAAKSLLLRPGFSLIIIAMLSLGIGANTAMFSWMNAFLLEPLRVEHPERWVKTGIRTTSGFIMSYSYPNFLDHLRLNDVFEELTASRMTSTSLTLGNENIRAATDMVSGSYFRALGGDPEIGRTFNEAEDTVPGRDAVAVLSYGFWQRQFGGDPDVVGREVLINSHPFTLIGVMRADFGFARAQPAAEIWVPLSMQEEARPGQRTIDDRGSAFLQVQGRLKPGVDIEQAERRLNVMHAALVEQYPGAIGGTTVSVEPSTRAYLGPVGGALGMIFGILMGVIGAVLLIACVNVANLLLARGADRQREIGVRLALGASRRRIVRQLLTESLLLSAVAAVFGVALAFWINRLLTTFQPPLPVPITLLVDIDGRVLFFTTTIAILTGLLFGTIPALRTSGANLVGALHGGNARVSSGNRLRNGLVTFQIAVSLILLISAGLFARSLQNANSIDPGFRSDGVVLATLDPGLQGMSLEEARGFYRDLFDRASSLPGVGSVSFAEMLPMALGTQQWGTRIDGYEPGENERMNLDYNFVSPGYMASMGIPVLEGREFEWTDTAESEGAAIINATMAARYWPEGSAIGGRLRSAGMDRTVVGVVADAKYYTLGEEPMPYMYFPYMQSSQTALSLHVRTSAPFEATVDAVRAEVRAINRNLPIFDVRSLDAQMSIALLPARMTAALLVIFGGFALLLAGVGLYGVMAYAVGQRTQEIGIRMALGASRRVVMRMVLRNAGVLLLAGAGLGTLGGIGLGRLAQTVLYGIGAADPLALGMALVVIVLTTAIAAWLPARRATRVDPVRALRTD